MIAEEIPSITALRRDIHAHPEVAYEESRTAGVIRRELDLIGVRFVGDLAGGTGTLAHLPAGTDGSNGPVALRADIDALPITEETGAPWSSTRPGCMHACGHDGHTAILIGAARVLARLARSTGLPQPVTLLFQPAEEGGAGGKRMVEDGCLDGRVLGPAVSRIYGLHGWTMMPLGSVGSRPGPMLAAADRFTIDIVGHGAHAAQPQASRDPIVAGSAIVQALQSIVARSIDPFDPVVVSVTQFHAGTTHNIIPERASIMGTVRTLRAEAKEIAIARLHTIAEGIARAHGCTAHIEYHHGYPVTRNDPRTFGTFEDVARRTLGSARVQPVEHPSMGGEDFSYYGEVVPACFFLLGLLPVGEGSMPGLHHPRFDFNDDALATGIEVFVRLALEG